MSIADAVLLGVVQGLTEFLPVSSSGHLVLFERFLDGFDRSNALFFNVTLHLGTLLSVIVHYRRDLVGMIRRFLNPSGALSAGQTARTASGSIPPTSPDWRFVGLIILAMIATALVGFPLRDFVLALFGDTSGAAPPLMGDAQRLRVVGLALIVTGLLLAASERLQIGKTGRENLGWKDALLVGAAQGISVLPGISRSGATISAALFRGVDGAQAVRFSFLLSVPAIFGAELYALLTRSGAHAVSVAGTDLPAYVLGTLTAFVVGLLAIRIIVATVQRGKLVYFAVYCWIAGGAVMILA